MTRCRHGPAHALSRDRVLRAALDLVDREGVDALTMRRLGRELGVEAMSLYGYVDSKEDLIEGVVEQVFRQMPLIVPGPGRWQDRLRRHAAGLPLGAARPPQRRAAGGAAAARDRGHRRVRRLGAGRAAGGGARPRDGRPGARRDRQLHAGPRVRAGGRRGARRRGAGRRAATRSTPAASRSCRRGRDEADRLRAASSTSASTSSSWGSSGCWPSRPPAAGATEDTDPRATTRSSAERRRTPSRPLEDPEPAEAGRVERARRPR